MKRILIPVLVLILLLIAYLIIQNNKIKSVTAERISNFLNLKAEDVTRFAIERMGSSLEFTREGASWILMIDSIPRQADTTTINEIVAMFANIEVGEMESDNPQKQGLYQVDSLTGTIVTFYKGQDELSSIIVGRNSQGYLYSYVRKPGSDLVYSGKGVKAFMLSKPAASFRNKSIIQIDTGTIASVRFQFRDESFVLERNDSRWLLKTSEADPGQPVNPDTLELFKRQLVNLRADDFINQSDSNVTLMDPPELMITLKYQNSAVDTLSLLGGNDSKTRYFIRRDGLNDIYMIQYSKYGQLLRRSNNFLLTEKNG